MGLALCTGLCLQLGSSVQPDPTIRPPQREIWRPIRTGRPVSGFVLILELAYPQEQGIRQKRAFVLFVRVCLLIYI